MITYHRTIWLFSAGLSGLAGFVDALGFIKLGGFFVSFMSGNSTRFGVGLVQDHTAALTAGLLVVLFVAGVTLGFSVGNLFKRASLVLVAASLLGAAIAESLGASYLAIALIVIAMGAENTTFQRNGEVSIALTYMTGTLVRLGQHIAAALTGGSKTNWIPYLLLWLGFVAGAILGTLAYAQIGMQALWIAAALAVALYGVAGRVPA